MDVSPKYSPVGEFFKYQPVYRVPAYQRSYSWEQLEIEDFIKDLENCYNKRKYETAIVHFFGQIVCIEDELPGAYQHKYYQLVDGQQRIVTFILLVASLLNIYKEIITEINGDPSFNNQKGILEGRIQDLTKRYISFRKEVQEAFKEIDVIELSNRDSSFFKSFLQDVKTVPQRQSHELIKFAYDLIYNKVKEITNSGNLKDRIGNLKMIEEILEKDFCILNMVTNDRKAAFKLFQVLNNRGKNLTEGDLLRAESLRILETHTHYQKIVEEVWDDILRDSPIDTEIFLRSIYGAYKGVKAGTNSLFNEFLTFFIPEYEYEHISVQYAESIKDKIQKIGDDINVLRKLNSGQWPYTAQSPIEHWDRKKLYDLIHALGHTECLPLLLSAFILRQTEFNTIVQVLERFIFRYLIIGNQYIGDLITLYYEEAKIIRDNPAGYTVANLKQKLQPLADKVSEPMFCRMLDDFKYTRLGKSNKPLKYFLLSLEYYYRWYKEGANGNPQCNDKERVYDFTDSTIEHVYPHNGVGAVVNIDLEPLKNNIGNLTILGNTDNRTGDNDEFLTKKPIYQASSLMINREDIAQRPTWDKSVVENRIEEMKKMACAIFKL